MQVVYQGPQERLEVAPEGIILERGEPQDVPKDVADKLLAQGAVVKWTPAKSRKSPARAAKANKDVESR